MQNQTVVNAEWSSLIDKSLFIPDARFLLLPFVRLLNGLDATIQ